MISVSELTNYIYTKVHTLEVDSQRGSSRHLPTLFLERERVKLRYWAYDFVTTKLPRVIRWEDFEGGNTLKNPQFMRMYIPKVITGKLNSPTWLNRYIGSK